LLRCLCRLLAHRDKSQSPEFMVGIDAKRTFVDKRSRPDLQRMTQSGCRRSKLFALRDSLFDHVIGARAQREWKGVERIGRTLRQGSEKSRVQK
jgi:hypothetical protein